MEHTEIIDAIQFATEFSIAERNLKEKAPFHFNLIDEVRANENAHSNILGKLLGYKENNKFVNLISFLDYIDLKLVPEKPKVLVEKDRIDIAILDRNNFAIIIENKIHYAVDQDDQIGRYVKIIKGRRYKMEQIYVLYLTKEGQKKPDKKSLDDKLRTDLEKRYIGINFKYHILPWLEDMHLKCRQKDQDLIHGLAQYIDHLKGMFNLRKKFEKMNDELDKLISNKIKLQTDHRENDAIILNKIKEFELCITHLNSLRKDVRNKLRKDFWKELLVELNNHESGWTCVNDIKDPKEIADANLPFFGLSNSTYQYKNTQLLFSVEVRNYVKFMCGVFCDNNEQREEIKKAFKEQEIELTIEKEKCWLYLHPTNYKYGKRRPAYFVYDVEWNSYYSNEMNGMVDMFSQQIIKVFEAWKKITKKSIK